MYYDLVESGKRIKALRKKHGLTQEKLAEQLGIAVNTVARIEIGNRGISIDLAIELAVRFDTTLDYIFLGRE
ncbi:MAG: helix-turn-helix transcriptional regulator [Oscillospiraceae bacterium]|nr:helix-turn-helix transcriptional regulator [Bacteroidaceae bacterium]MBQ3194211.1 helix-turn-helix transcriptional regulator [Oscillospiraceae bacterium]